MAEELILQDKRQLSRRRLIYYLKVIDRETGRLLGRLADIHKEGLMVMTEQPPPIGQDYQLDIELPKALLEKTRLPYLSVKAQAVWARPGLNHGFFEAGFRFEKLSPVNFRLLDYLLEKFEMPETG